MKLLDYYKIIKFPEKKKGQQQQFYLYHNDEPVEKIEVHSFKSHHEIYKRLRLFKFQQYELAYVMQRKKAFNTLAFRINYDVIVCDKDGKVIDILIDVAPGYTSQYYENGWKIFFFAVGHIKSLEIKKKDRLSFGLSLWKKWYLQKK